MVAGSIEQQNDVGNTPLKAQADDGGFTPYGPLGPVQLQPVDPSLPDIPTLDAAADNAAAPPRASAQNSAGQSQIAIPKDYLPKGVSTINGINYVGNGGNVATVAATLNSVPDYIDSFVSASGLTVHVTPNDIGQDPDFGNTPAANNIPRGWNGITATLPGMASPIQVTLGLLPGVYFPAANEVILATSPVVGQASYDVDVHEFVISGTDWGLISGTGYQLRKYLLG